MLDLKAGRNGQRTSVNGLGVSAVDPAQRLCALVSGGSWRTRWKSAMSILETGRWQLPSQDSVVVNEARP